MQSVALVLILVATGSWVNAVCRFEFVAQGCRVDGLDIASDLVLHLDSVPRILKCNPLYTVLVLTNHKRCCGRDGSGSSCTGIWSRSSGRSADEGADTMGVQWGSDTHGEFVALFYRARLDLGPGASVHDRALRVV